MSERTLLRIGAASAIVGAIASFVLLSLRPVHTGDIVDEAAATLQDILDSDIWIALHVVMILTILLILGSLGTLSRTITAQPAAAKSRLAFAFATIGTAVFLVLMASDAIGLKGIAEVWEGAAEADKPTALLIAQAFDEVNLALLGLWVALFFGVATAFYGLAISLSDHYPKWLGWAGIVVGLLITADGVAVALGEGFFVSVLLVLLWLVVMGVFLWRKADTAA